MGKPLGNIRLYEVAADSADLGELRVKVRKEMRVSLLFNGILAFIGLAMFFGNRGELFIKTALVTISVCYLPICLINLRSLSETSGRRLIKTDGRSIKDCIGIIAPNYWVTEYPYSQMRQSTKLADRFSIEMVDGRMLCIPLKAFAHRTDFNNFVKALAEQKCVPVIDLTDREVDGVS